MAITNEMLNALSGGGGLGNISGSLRLGAQFHWNGEVPDVRSDRDVDAEDDSLEQTSTCVTVLHALPKIKVSAYDIAQNEGLECAICLEVLMVGEAATRIPCGHLFHERCAQNWLAQSNKCPVCRYELPSSNAHHERGRRERMHGRRPRLRKRELTMKTVHELRRFADHLNVNSSDCLEKCELVDRIANSGAVEIVLEYEEEGNPNTASRQHCAVSRAQLASMSVRELKRMLVNANVTCDGCIEKHELLDRLASSGTLPGAGS